MTSATVTWRFQVDQATEFFGENFGVARPVPTEPVVEQPKPQKGAVQSALEFFGMDFTAPKSVPRNTAAPTTGGASKFDTVFNKLIGQESGGNHTDSSGNLTTSPKGAKGITQVMPNTGDDPGFGVDPIKDKSQSEYIRFGKDYLKAMLKEFDGDYEKALAAYNSGVGNVKKAIEDGGSKWKDKLPKKEETIPYINNILGKR